jgi:adenylylsulfate kinase
VIVVAFAGLPGSGKSTLANAVGRALGAPVFDKDRVRAALFEPNAVEYTREQDDLVIAAIHATVRGEARLCKRAVVVLDGRTYSRRADVAALAELAREIGARLALVHCTCSVECARARVRADRERHLARDRSPELVDAIAARFEAIALPHFTLDTERFTPDAALALVLSYVGELRAR